MTTTKTIYITSDDYTRLRLLADSVAQHKTASSAAARELLSELGRAVTMATHEISPTVVRLGSRVTIEDLADGQIETYLLTLPERANAEEGRLSVLAPIGTAILGYAEGDAIDWETPGGLRRIKIRSVEQPAGDERAV